MENDELLIYILPPLFDFDSIFLSRNAAFLSMVPILSPRDMFDYLSSGHVLPKILFAEITKRTVGNIHFFLLELFSSLIILPL